jgi:hypothetical protein
MTQFQCFRTPRRHRRLPGECLDRCVDYLWQREHPGVEAWPIENLGLRNYTPRHARSPQRRRVYL